MRQIINYLYTGTLIKTKGFFLFYVGCRVERIFPSHQWKSLRSSCRCRRVVWHRALDNFTALGNPRYV